MKIIVNKLITLPHNIKIILLIFLDILIIFFSLWLSFSLRLGYYFNPRSGSDKYTYWFNEFMSQLRIDVVLFDLQLVFLISLFTSILSFYYFKLYKLIIRYF